MKYILFI